MEQPPEGLKVTTDSRAKELDHGENPVEMTNAIAKLQIKPNARDSTLGISAQKWAFEQYWQQKQLLATLTDISLRDTPFQYANTWINVNTRFFRTLGTLFRVKSWKLHLKFEVVSNFQEQGLDIVYFTNCPGPDAEMLALNVTDATLPIEAVWQLPHRKIMLGEQTTVDAALEWISPFKGAFDDSDFRPSQNVISYHMGTIFYRNIIPRQVATGVTASRTVRVYGYLSNVEYAGYAPQDTI